VTNARDANEPPCEMKTRTHFAHRIDMLDAAGEIQEHLTGVEDYLLAEAVLAQSNLPLAESTHRSFAKARESFMTAAGCEWAK
jgi:hypothetical protein